MIWFDFPHLNWPKPCRSLMSNILSFWAHTPSLVRGHSITFMHCLLAIPQCTFAFKLLETQLCFPRSNRHIMSREQDLFMYHLYKNIQASAYKYLEYSQIWKCFLMRNKYPADQCSTFKPQLPSCISVNVLKVCVLAQGSLTACSRLRILSLFVYWKMGLSYFKLEAYFTAAVGS